ncbi:MAG: TIGR01777 family oxidoreductase [Flavobacteriaceae bacterium]|nr:TIGR01777 family oxidoreductase [Flavobacteriaceae bacterium]
MKILITGATGLIGKEVIRLCEQRRYKVHYLTTSKEKLIEKDTVSGFYWNPSTQEIDEKCLKEIDGVINLAGSSIAQRWTSKNKREILNSRINSIHLLHKLLVQNSNKVKSIVSASAIGIYPPSFSKEYDESEQLMSNSFLGKVTKSWEEEIDRLNDLHIRICKLRIGIVLSKKGGALAQITKPIKFGFGAALGSGNQFQSWIHNTDAANLFLFAIENNLKGVYNAVAPNPVTNKELTNLIANHLKKPLWLPNVPSIVLKIILGEMAAIALESQKVNNSKILDSGFSFKYENIEDALSDCLS